MCACVHYFFFWLFFFVLIFFLTIFPIMQNLQYKYYNIIVKHKYVVGCKHKFYCKMIYDKLSVENATLLLPDLNFKKKKATATTTTKTIVNL